MGGGEGVEAVARAPGHAWTEGSDEGAAELLPQGAVQDEVDGRVQVDQEVAQSGQHVPGGAGGHGCHGDGVGHVVDECGHLAHDKHHHHRHQHDGHVVLPALKHSSSNVNNTITTDTSMMVTLFSRR